MAFWYVFVKSYMHICQVQLQDAELVPTAISHHFLDRCIGYSLDNVELVSFVN